jgi:dUTP pyrophosphatase
MKVRLRRIDKDLPLPVYKTAGSVCFDLITRETTIIEPGALARVPCNVVVETPAGYMLMLVPRSSMPSKKPGLIYPHGVGVIDQDYSGDNDELLFQVMNVGDSPITVERGETIAQAGFVKIDRADFEEVDSMEKTDRGGFGSTDQVL